MSTPPVDFGCRNATRLPRIPVRGCFVDKAQAGVAHRLEGRVDVIRPVRHVVKAGSAPFEELPDRRVRAERPQQLDMALADPEEHCLDALLRDRLAVLERHAEPLLVEPNGVVEVLDGHADVIDPPEHGRVSLGSARYEGLSPPG